MGNKFLNIPENKKLYSLLLRPSRRRRRLRRRFCTLKNSTFVFKNSVILFNWWLWKVYSTSHTHKKLYFFFLIELSFIFFSFTTLWSFYVSPLSHIIFLLIIWVYMGYISKQCMCYFWKIFFSPVCLCVIVINENSIR